MAFLTGHLLVLEQLMPITKRSSRSSIADMSAMQVPCTIPPHTHGTDILLTMPKTRKAEVNIVSQNNPKQEELIDEHYWWLQ